MASLIRPHYDKYWGQVKKLPHSAYERDAVFPQIFTAGDKVLDVACGNGDSSEHISEITHTPVCGLDISPVAVKEARKKGIKAVVGDVESKFPYLKDSFDVVFWGDNIEHIFSPDRVVAEIYRVLKPGGRLIISTPNMGYWRYRISYLVKGSIPDTEFDGRSPWEWSHIRFFNRPVLEHYLTMRKFTVIRTRGVNRRKIDRWLAPVFPGLFGMIIIIEAVKPACI